MGVRTLLELGRKLSVTAECSRRFPHGLFCGVIFALLCLNTIANAQELRDRPSIYEEDFQEHYESTPESPEPVMPPDGLPLLFSHFDFGSSKVVHPSSDFEDTTHEHTLYNLGLGIDFPLYVRDNFAVSSGVRFNINYPIFVNLKQGEGLYHLNFGPFVSTPFGFLLGESVEFDFVPSLSYEIERHEYAMGDISIATLHGQLEWKFKVLSWRLWSMRPIFGVMGAGYGLGSQYKYTYVDENRVEDTEFNTPRSAIFSSSGAAYGYSFGINAGVSFDLESSANDELLFGFRVDSSTLKRLKAIETGVLTDKEFFSTTYTLMWRRAWQSN